MLESFRSPRPTAHSRFHSISFCAIHFSIEMANLLAIASTEIGLSIDKPFFSWQFA